LGKGLASTTPALFYSVGVNSPFEYQNHVSQPIIFKRGTSLVAPVLLWLMDALPAVLAGVMFYPLTKMYDVDFDRPFLVLSILAATFTLAVLPSNATSQVVSGRIELATNLLWRWAVLVACLLALGYITKFSEEYSRRVVVTWVLVTPVLLVMLQLLLHSITRAMLMDAFCHQGPVADIVVVKKPRLNHPAAEIGFPRDVGRLGVDDCPAALGLHPPEMSLLGRKISSVAGALRGLVEAILHRLRPDLDGLKEDVVFRVACHGGYLPLDLVTCTSR